jgi:hypothetical protein
MRYKFAPQFDSSLPDILHQSLIVSSKLPPPPPSPNTHPQILYSFVFTFFTQQNEEIFKVNLPADSTWSRLLS